MTYVCPHCNSTMNLLVVYLFIFFFFVSYKNIKLCRPVFTILTKLAEVRINTRVCVCVFVKWFPIFYAFDTVVVLHHIFFIRELTLTHH